MPQQPGVPYIAAYRIDEPPYETTPLFWYRTSPNIPRRLYADFGIPPAWRR